MIKRIVITTVIASFVTSVGFSQTRYSRPRSSPTPTPTPTAAPQQKMATRSRQSPAPFPRATPMPSPTKPTMGQRTMPAPRTTPAPSPVQAKATPASRTTVVPGQQKLTSPASAQPRIAATATPAPQKPTPTPVPPPDVKTYFERQLAKSKDQKFHMAVNGGDLALTPFHVWSQRNTGPNTTSTLISMRSDEGRVYDIEFMTTGAQVTGIRISKINGESVR